MKVVTHLLFFFMNYRKSHKPTMKKIYLFLVIIITLSSYAQKETDLNSKGIEYAKEGNYKKPTISGGIGTIFSRLTLESPIVKDKGSVILAMRRSYIDVLAKPFLPKSLDGSRFYFYDITAKANYRLGKKT